MRREQRKAEPPGDEGQVAAGEILQRITKEDGAATDVYDFLVSLPWSDLKSLLLYVFESKAANISLKDFNQQLRENTLTFSSDFDQRVYSRLENLIYKVVPSDFRGVELSPINIFGANSMLAGVNQKNVMSAIKGAEVTADATVALALENVRERQKRGSEEINLCSHHRTLRLQRYEEGSGFTPHFKIFAMTSAGRDTGHDSFEQKSLFTHISIYLKILEKARSEAVWLENVEVTLSDIGITEKVLTRLNIEREDLGKKIRRGDLRLFDIAGIVSPSKVDDVSKLSPELISHYQLEENVERLGKLSGRLLPTLKGSFPNVAFSLEMDRVGGVGYYNGYCFKVNAANSKGERYQLADGGFTDWSQILLADKKERLLASGLGTEFLIRKYGNHRFETPLNG